MPSSTRKCFAKKLRDYLTFKSVVFNVTVQSETELLSMLNTAEIQTVGGEILLTWGGSALSSIVNPEVAHEVLMEVALTLPSHFLTNGVLCSCVQQMADSLLSLMIQQQNGLVDFTVLAHLHNLLPFSDSRVLTASVSDMKMYVRTVLSQEEKTLCLNRKERDLMRSFILRVRARLESLNHNFLISHTTGLWLSPLVELPGPGGARRPPDCDEEHRPRLSQPDITEAGGLAAGCSVKILNNPL